VFYDAVSSLPSAQHLATGPCLCLTNAIDILALVSSRQIPVLERLGLPNGPFSSGFPKATIKLAPKGGRFQALSSVI